MLDSSDLLPHSTELLPNSIPQAGTPATHPWWLHALRRAEEIIGYPLSPETRPEITQPQNDENPDTAALLLPEVEKMLDNQDAQAGALDTKAGFVLGSASLITTAVAALQIVVRQQAHLGQPAVVAFHVAGVGAFVFYVLVVLAAFNGYRLRGYRRSPDADAVRKYLEVTNKMLANRARNFLENKVTLNQKAWWTRASIGCLLIESVFVAVVGVVQVFGG